MKKLLNTLYVNQPDVYLSLDGENIVFLGVNNVEVNPRRPLHLFEGIVSFGYRGVSPALMGKCVEMGISLSFCKPSGRFLAEVSGEVRGNVLLRRKHYRIADDVEQSLSLAKVITAAKITNSRWVLERATRDHALQVDGEKITRAITSLKKAKDDALKSLTHEELMGIEGKAASSYFWAFDELILHSKEHFYFKERTKRPPMDNVNALLSFVYSLLTKEIASALIAVGLDPFVGFIHKERPGRHSLALDLIEELRAPVADRFVLTLINTRRVNAKGFTQKENGAVMMDENTRKTFLTAWQEHKKEQLTHPYLKEKISWGLVPHAQAQLLASYLRGDLDGYPPFLWK
ncbi:MAG: type I-C CRISPR-associated endonuclease Cas1c [Spirochaetaceae bacterium]|nr:type I-C CRISPR-associated endonuclease Cas1c [Spirochaetaceae bacterium]